MTVLLVSQAQELPMPYRPKLDPKLDLAGATPETLVRALFRREPLRPRPGGEPVVANEPPVSEGASHESLDDDPHLVERV